MLKKFVFFISLFFFSNITILSAEIIPLKKPLQTKEEKDQNVDSKNNGNYIKSDTKNTNWGKIPRNAKCPCGSGKKYKHCCGK